MRRSPGLSDRELDVLELALHGLSHQQIGQRLFLSVDTVKSHFRRMYAALQDGDGRSASGALHAVALALRKGELDFDPVTRTLVRPGTRARVPSRVPATAVEGTRAVERSVQQRRQELGW